MLEDYMSYPKNENLYAYQLSAHVLKLFGMKTTDCLRNFIRCTITHNDNYKSNLKILNMICCMGKKEVYDGLSLI